MATKKKQKKSADKKEKKSSFFKFLKVGDRIVGSFMHFEKSIWHKGEKDEKTSPVVALMVGDEVQKVNLGAIVLHAPSSRLPLPTRLLGPGPHGVPPPAGDIRWPPPRERARPHRSAREHRGVDATSCVRTLKRAPSPSLKRIATSASQIAQAGRSRPSDSPRRSGGGEIGQLERRPDESPVASRLRRASTRPKRMSWLLGLVR